MLEIKNLTTGYDKPIIKNLNITIDDGEILCVIGPNGCGKSTLLKAIINLLDYDGLITYNNISLKAISNNKRGSIIGLLSQNRSSYFSYTIYDAVKMGAYTKSNNMLQINISDDKINNVLKIVDLENNSHQKIDEISGGQFQRAMIARLLLQNPQIIMLDEPTNHLDLKHQIDILSNIKHHVSNNKKIGIIVLHDLNLVFKFATKVMLIDSNGNYVIGSPKEILTNDNINKVYNIDIKQWMESILNLWK